MIYISLISFYNLSKNCLINSALSLAISFALLVKNLFWRFFNFILYSIFKACLEESLILPPSLPPKIFSFMYFDKGISEYILALFSPIQQADLAIPIAPQTSSLSASNRILASMFWALIFL